MGETLQISSNNRVVALDGLRGLFAVCVLLYHYRLWFNLNVPQYLADLLERTSIYAVCGFFVISGASMAIAYRSKPPVTVSGVTAFLLKRFFRIAPLYYAVLLLHIAGRLHRCVTGELCNIDWGKIGANIFFVFGLGRAAEQSAVVAGWSIGIEWGFYFLFPILCWIALQFRFGVNLLLATSACMLVIWDMSYLSQGGEGWTAYAQLPAYLFYFCAGLAIGFAVAGRGSHKVRPSNGLRVLLTAFSIYLLVDLIVVTPFDSAKDVAGPLAWLFGTITCLSVFGAAFSSPQSAAVDRLLEIAGDLSYAVYLLHFPVFVGVTAFGAQGWSGFVMSVAATGAIAALAFRYVERPMIRLGRYLTRDTNRVPAS